MKTDPRKSLNDYARYSGMAIQMLAIILAGTFAGVKLDKWLDCKPLFTIFLLLGSVVLAIYFFIRDLLKKKS